MQFFTKLLRPVTRVPFFGRQLSQQSPKQPLTRGTTLKSESGRIYKIEELLAVHRHPLPCIYRASADGRNYVMKEMIPGEFEYQLDLQKRLSSCPNVRAVIDTVKEHELFVFPFLSTDLLYLCSNKKLGSEETRRDILRSALQGLADMHDRDIAHNDIKPNNILMDYDESVGEVSVRNVMISDLEDTVILLPGGWISEGLCGNALWRSPESWCRARQNRASDVFSFGIVMIYVMVDEMVFDVGDEGLDAEDSWRYVLPRHISYFADEDGLSGFLEHIGTEKRRNGLQNPFYEHLITLTKDPGNPRQSFAKWDHVEPDLRDLVGKMTNLDPARRITAREALQHRWFS